MEVFIKTFDLIECTEIYLNETDNICIINDKKFSIKNIHEIIKRLVGITANWENNYTNPLPMLDGASFFIEFNLDGKKTSYKGINAFPKNYYDFTKLIKEITNGKTNDRWHKYF